MTHAYNLSDLITASMFRYRLRTFISISLTHASFQPLSKTSSANASCAFSLAALRIASCSRGGRLRISCIRFANDDASVPWKPVRAPDLVGVIISSKGPAEACASGIRPDACYGVEFSVWHGLQTLPACTMNSTTLIPKCSSTIVFKPIDASPNR